MCIHVVYKLHLNVRLANLDNHVDMLHFIIFTHHVLMCTVQYKRITSLILHKILPEKKHNDSIFLIHLLN